MESVLNNKKWIIAFLTLALLLLVGNFIEKKDLQQQLNQLEMDYQKAEKANTLGERKKAFNQVLEGYMRLEKDYNPMYGDGKFYYNLGNAYFQLEEYPLAILNYEKGKNLLADTTKDEINLEIARQKLGIVEKKERSVLDHALFIQKWPLPLRLQLLSMVTALLFLTLSVYIWKKIPGLKTFIFLLSVLFLILLGSAVYSRFFAPVYGIVIHPGYLYRDAGVQYAKVKENPLTPGLKVEILGYSTEGEEGWMRITTPQKEFGFIKGMDVQIIGP